MLEESCLSYQTASLIRNIYYCKFNQFSVTQRIPNSYQVRRESVFVYCRTCTRQDKYVYS